MVKHLPTMQETQVQSLGWEDPLEKKMATHSSILSWLRSKSLQAINAGEGVEIREPSYTVGGNAN